MLYARREAERLADRLVSHSSERAVCEPNLDAINWRGPAWMDQDIALRGHLRLL